jgi:hypothetical protein
VLRSAESGHGPARWSHVSVTLTHVAASGQGWPTSPPSGKVIAWGHRGRNYRQAWGWPGRPWGPVGLAWSSAKMPKVITVLFSIFIVPVSSHATAGVRVDGYARQRHLPSGHQRRPSRPTATIANSFVLRGSYFMPHVKILVGLCGCGKSHMARDLESRVVRREDAK